ncbi:uncharacterized protein ACB058_015389 [Synchiropus picturatus]
MTGRTLLLASAVLAGLVASLVAAPAPAPAPTPYQPFCAAIWLFGTPCAEISAALTQQIEAFSPLFGCPDCHYNLVTATPLRISANHTSADGLQAESISFSFSPMMMAGCRVSGRSATIGFSTTLLDGGLNYCNLYNLLAASGLTSAPGFMEMTNEWACLGFGTSQCKL